MHLYLRRALASAPAAFLLTLGTILAGCGGDSATPPSPAAPDIPPQIRIQGVQAGAAYDGPVTITVQVEPAGAVSTIELNGARFSSGGTVTDRGDHLLSVEATHAGVKAEVTIPFRIRLVGDRKLILRMLDLGPEGLGGGGEAILLTDSSSVGMIHGMVDAGPRGERGRPLDEGWVARRLVELGVDRLAFLQLTHAHADHLGGMIPILETIPVERFVYNGQVRSFGNYELVLAAARARADTVMILEEPWTYTLGSGAGATQTIHLPGLPTYLGQDTSESRRINEGSVGTAVQAGGVRMFLTGDGEDESNARWRTTFAEHTQNLAILKVGHHGANNAIFDDRFGNELTSTWLDHTRARLFLISSNGISHPRTRALSRIFGVKGAQAYCTSVHGEITVRIAGGAWTVDVERNADKGCAPGLEAST
jgi:beta-lactamase superfamily II metal-dependent hydrolase